MINITFKISNKDYSDKLSTFKCLQSPSNVKIITTLDGTDKQFIGKLKSKITVSFLPLTKAQLFELYELVKEYSFLVTYTNPYIEDDVIQKMRIDGDINSSFALVSIDGNKYYTGLSLTFKQM